MPRGHPQCPAGLFRPNGEHRLARPGPCRLTLDRGDGAGGGERRCPRPAREQRAKANAQKRGVDRHRGQGVDLRDLLSSAVFLLPQPGWSAAQSGIAMRRTSPRISLRSIRATLAWGSVIARSEATKQSISPRKERVDCFASLAMTVSVALLLAMTALRIQFSSSPPRTGTASRSRRTFFARGLPINFPPPEIQRAQGMPGAQCARGLACKIEKHTSIVTTVTPERPGIPRAMVLRLTSRSPR